MIAEACSCGNGINHPKVIHKTQYTKWGWFLFTILGLSANPKNVSFICTNCNKKIFETNNKELLKKYVGR
jgi:hypothetical protein